MSRSRYFAVYQTVHEPLDESALLRVFLLRVDGDSEYLYRRFQLEARRFSDFKHNQLVRVLDVGRLPEGLPYIVQERPPGHSLQELLRATERLPAPRVFRIFEQATSALAIAHKRGFCHQGLTTANILIGTDRASGQELIQIDNLGLVALWTTLAQKHPSPPELVDLLGTPYYLSPEQCSDAKVDGRSDIYSIGCIMYEAVSGHPPFETGSQSRIIEEHRQAPPRSLKQACPELLLPRSLVDIVDKCLMKLPGDRYQLVETLHTDINEEQSPEMQGPAELTEKLARAQATIDEDFQVPLRRIWLLGTLAILLVLSGFVAIQVLQIFAGDLNFDRAMTRAERQFDLGQFREAKDAALQAVKEAHRFPQPDRRLARGLNLLCQAQLQEDRYLEAARSAQEALALESPEDPERVWSQALLSTVRLHQGNPDEARSLAGKALMLSRIDAGVSAPSTHYCRVALAEALLAADKADEARKVVDQVPASDNIPIWLSTRVLECKALCQAVRGELTAAKRNLTAALSQRQEELGLSSPWAAETMILLAGIYSREQSFAKATAALENAFSIQRQSLGDDCPATAATPALLARAYESCGNLVEAEKNYRLALELNAKIWGDMTPPMIPYIKGLGEFLGRRGNISAANVYKAEIEEIEAKKLPGRP